MMEGQEPDGTLSMDASLEFGQTKDYIPDKFKFDIEDLIKFIFPASLQHPLAAGRLFAFADCGPLDENLCLRSGAQGKRIVAEYELTQMCLQYEKEDIVQIYLHKSRDMGLLTSKEQEMVISQADAHLKKAKGKASLPRLWKKDIYELLEDLPRDDKGLISFHEAQEVIAKYRQDRIKEFKLVYPSIKTKKEVVLPAIANGPATTTMDGTNDDLNATDPTSPVVTKKKRPKRISRVGDTVAPPTMFQRMKGNTNADLIEQTTGYLSKHAFKICDIDAKSSASITSNVKLLRELPPYCRNPYPKEGPRARESWNDNSTMQGVGLGSMVKSVSSSTTWKRKTTTY
mmetsp:Transcript_21905/g.36672  ORF Transcript_21905/g.36672 Transcript_21905/m.36672 type:complete len:343 (+) Transcript_21905:83-1111(+)